MTNWHQVFTYDSSPFCHGCPEQSGVYVIFLAKCRGNKIRKRLVYIGSSSNLKNRLNRSHPVINRNFGIGFVTVAYAKLDKEYALTEKKLIKKLKPFCNKTFKK